MRWWTFAAVCGALSGAPGSSAAEEPSAQPTADDASGAGVCETDIRLQGTVYEHRHPERSFAMLRTPRSARGGLYRPGMGIDSFRVVSIEPRGVLLRTGDDFCWLRLKPGAVSRPKAKAKAEPSSPKKWKRGKPAFSAEELDRGVRKLSDTRYQIEQQLITEAFSRIGRLSRTTSFRTVQRGGRPYGMRVSRIVRDGLLERAGLQRGDIVRTLNGIDLGTAQGALQARTQLTAAKQLSLSLVRDGKPLTIEYAIR